MLQHKYKIALGILATAQIFTSSAAWAAVSFNQAVADYNAGKYTQAMAEFKTFVAAYPSNAQSHYYLALCYQSLGCRAEAREEFTLVTRYSSGTLATYAQQALHAMGSASSTGTTVAMGPATTPAPAQTQASAGAVTQVYDFYTDW